MEGTFTTADALALSEAGIQRLQTPENVEVANYIRALSWAVDQLDTLPISGRLLKGAHARLLADVGKVRGQDKQPGEYARDQNMIGGTNIERARFIPPPPAQTLDAMTDLERFINRAGRADSSPLIDLALVHYQFETIHPFADGNGRLGRMLITLMGMTERLLDMPVLYMSPELEKRKDAYIDQMYQVSATGDWAGWIRFFLDVLTASCNRTVNTIDRIIDLHRRYHAIARSVSNSSNIIAVIDMLFEHPVIQPRHIVERLHVTDVSARNLLRKLAEAGLLLENRDFYPAAWFAPEILQVSRPDP